MVGDVWGWGPGPEDELPLSSTGIAGICMGDL